MLTAMLTGLPYSFTTHARDIFRSGINDRILRDKVLRADFVVCVSDYNKTHLLKRTGAPESLFRVVYNGVDLDRFHPAGEPATNLVLGVGRLVPKKGFPDLVSACRAIASRGTHVRLCIVGSGPMEPDLADQARLSAVDLTLSGSLPQDELAGMYNRATVVVQPSVIPQDGNIDSLPTVLLEAMASGRPVVSTRVGGIPEIVDEDVNGLIVEPGDIAALASAIERILADDKLGQRLGQAARMKAEAQFDVNRNAGLLYRLFTRPARVDSTPNYESGLPQH
jgi:glycosyltransferase involved in cell wall biosynthesis